jgi:hypothetical protein
LAAEQKVELSAVQSDADDGCAHHWLIDTPNGESSSARCKSCGKTRDFLNYSQRKVMTRSVKPAAGQPAKMSV